MSKHYLTSTQFITLYYSLIHPHLTYGCLAWGTASNKDIHTYLQMIQNKAVGSIFNGKYNVTVNGLYSKLGIPKLEQFIKYKCTDICFQLQIYSTSRITTPFSNKHECPQLLYKTITWFSPPKEHQLLDRKIHSISRTKTMVGSTPKVKTITGYTNL